MLWGQLLVAQLVRLGCTRFYAAPGSRSAPLTLAAAGHQSATLTMGYDERSLGFCAVGCGRAVRKPAAVMVTSGTAVANLYPAVVEAWHDHIPLLLLTADRPDYLRHSGANQTINQINIFGGFVRWHTSLPTPSEHTPQRFVIATVQEALQRAQHPDPGPVHLNIPLFPCGGLLSPSESSCHTFWGPLPETSAEPKPFEAPQVWKAEPRRGLQPVIDVLKRARQGLVIVAGGYGDDDDGTALEQLLTRLGWPVFAEGLCAARYRKHSCIVPSFDLLLGCSQIATSFCPDVVLQLGTRVVSPTLDRWLQRRAAGGGDGTPRRIYIMAGEHLGTVDPHFAVTHRLPLQNFVASVLDGLRVPQVQGSMHPHDQPNRTINHNVIRDGLPSSLPQLSCQTQAIIHKTLAGQKRLTEPFVARCISRVACAIAAEQESFRRHILFLGNSMPVRDMGRFAVAPVEKNSPFAAVMANRGASGIDGVLSTACGAAHATNSPVTLAVGDLSFLHDCNGLALLKETKQPVTVVVVNNCGGGIFALLPFARASDVFERCFQARHNHNLGSLCAAFDVPHTAVDRAEAFEQAYTAALQSGKTSVIEACTDSEHDRALRRQIEQAVDSIARRQLGQ